MTLNYEVRIDRAGGKARSESFKYVEPFWQSPAACAEVCGWEQNFSNVHSAAQSFRRSIKALRQPSGIKVAIRGERLYLTR